MDAKQKRRMQKKRDRKGKPKCQGYAESLVVTDMRNGWDCTSIDITTTPASTNYFESPLSKAGLAYFSALNGNGYLFVPSKLARTAAAEMRTGRNARIYCGTHERRWLIVFDDHSAAPFYMTIPNASQFLTAEQPFENKTGSLFVICENGEDWSIPATIRGGERIPLTLTVQAA